jgi:hypothetical protein
MSRTRTSGLGLELIELSHALESVRLVSDCGRNRSFADVADARIAPRAVSATVGLVAERLRALAAALSSEPEAPAARPRRRGVAR